MVRRLAKVGRRARDANLHWLRPARRRGGAGASAVMMVTAKWPAFVPCDWCVTLRSYVFRECVVW